MSYSDDAFATIMLMSQVNPDRAELVNPLTVSEYHNLRERVGESNLRHMSRLIDMDMSGLTGHLSLTEKEAYRICLLLNRVLPISISIEGFMNEGIGIVTVDDERYPEGPYDILGKKAPPMFYYAGQIEILKRHAVGIFGNEPLFGDAEARVRGISGQAVKAGLAIVSDGMAGFGRVAGDHAYEMGGYVIEVLPGGMSDRLRDERIVRMMEDDRLLLISLTHPGAPVTESHALDRNKFLYSLPLASLVFAVRENGGGAMRGATDALKWTKGGYIYAWKTPVYPGNESLINRGAIPFDGDDARFSAMLETWRGSVAEQISLFEDIRPFV